MAHTSTHNDAHFSIFGAIQNVFSTIGSAFVMMAQSDSRMRQIEALNALSDAELAERGLRRDEIARYVFNDVFWV
ncbi:DUF1127 domain-containing protein [Sedimentitalea sp. JM2-8]|uniref:DUF1127 domain-containing protein n=1 Tax=Sedimentitalea xiamensis TaxID=3050037 RepID=A0ABT7FI58_9RHOB|nr:DUF1127 domain-containing protein [Sedimentitalea xiamensis]MDK3074796.1 DUF1127 domain-containing protein [Sedimentitalea xiamensis]